MPPSETKRAGLLALLLLLGCAEVPSGADDVRSADASTPREAATAAVIAAEAALQSKVATGDATTFHEAALALADACNQLGDAITRERPSDEDLWRLHAARQQLAATPEERGATAAGRQRIGQSIRLLLDHLSLAPLPYEEDSSLRPELEADVRVARAKAGRDTSRRLQELRAARLALCECNSRSCVSATSTAYLRIIAALEDAKLADDELSVVIEQQQTALACLERLRDG